MPEQEPEEIIAAAIERHLTGAPAILALGIIELLWDAGYEIRPRSDLPLGETAT